MRAVAARVLSPRHVRLTVGGAAAGSGVEQRVRVVKVKAKWGALRGLLAEAAAEAAAGDGGGGGVGSRAVVFANTKRAVAEIGQYCHEVRALDTLRPQDGATGLSGDLPTTALLAMALPAMAGGPGLHDAERRPHSGRARSLDRQVPPSRRLLTYLAVACLLT